MCWVLISPDIISPFDRPLTLISVFNYRPLISVNFHFRWFNGSHGFVIENGNVVSSRLNNFWYQCRTRDKKERRIMSWRKATAEDVGEMTQMICYSPLVKVNLNVEFLIECPNLVYAYVHA